MTELKSISLTAVLDVQAGADAADGKPALPRFSMVAYTGGPMRIAGWRFPVIVDLAGLAIPSQGRPIRFGHDASNGVGHSDSIRVEGGKLIAAGVVSRDTTAAREIVVSAKNGFPWQASIGASVEQFEFVKENQQVLVNGRDFTGPINVVRKATLGEISFVDLGADGNTSAQVAARAKENIVMDGTETTTTQDTATLDGKDAVKVEAQAAGKEAGTPAVTAAAEAGITADPVAPVAN